MRGTSGHKFWSPPPNPRIDDLAARPKLLVSAKSARDLENQLRGLHGNHPLVVLGLHHPKAATQLSETCHALLDGVLPCDDWGESATGHLLVTDPCNTLAALSHQTNPKISWLGRMVWLVDGDNNDEWENLGAEESETTTLDMGVHFGEALVSVLSHRLDNHNSGTRLHEFDLIGAQRRWASFLRESERRLPGITGAARAQRERKEPASVLG